MALLLSVGLVPPAVAGDGRAQINQGCASIGCFPGDGPGFPVTIDGSAGTSYLLTSDLEVADAALDAISITVDDVSIDLNGFELVGPVSCSGAGSTVVCDPGSGRGISAASANGVAVRDGRVRGFGAEGIQLGERAHVTRVAAESNGGDGIFVERASIVVGSLAERNGGDGLELFGRALVERSVSRSNRLRGFYLVTSATAFGNSAYENGTDGFYDSGSCVVRDNSAIANEDRGFVGGNGTLMSDNAAHDNGGDGFVGATGTLMRRNVSRNNGGYGLHFLLSGVYGDNTINGNTSGTVSGSSGDTGGNVCDGSLVCP